MLINFTKMHGLGNDFVVVDNTSGSITFSAEQIIALAHRHFGVGFDQLLMVESTNIPNVDFRYLIYNADGTEVEQCGNGARCFARFVSEKGLSNTNPIRVETTTGVIELLINDDKSVSVDMGEASFEPSAIGLLLPKADYYRIENTKFGAVSMGNPHLVRIVDDLDVDISIIATAVQGSKLLQNSANIGFIRIVNKNEIKLRVYERGVGETLACGSGACAAVAYGIKAGLLENSVVVHLNGGDVLIEQSDNAHMFLSGPATFVFEAQIEI